MSKKEKVFDVDHPSAAKMIGVSDDTLYRWARRNVIEHRRRGAPGMQRGRFFYCLTDVEQVAKACKEGVSPSSPGSP